MFYRRAAMERARLYQRPRRWLVNSTVTLNIYGEPGEPVTGTDGVTSISSAKTFSSAAVDFVAAGVAPTDILEIFVESDDDAENGRYLIGTVAAHTLGVDRNWPIGSKTNRKFRIHFADERYQDFGQLVPFYIKLDPSEDDLSKWGIEEKRDALVVLSVELCNSIGLTPKIGDRFIYEYETRHIHYEMKEMKLMEQLGDSGVPIYLVGGAMKTSDRLGA
jgi:hypothetical protein